jgi:hypothetical protein
VLCLYATQAQALIIAIIYLYLSCNCGFAASRAKVLKRNKPRIYYIINILKLIELVRDIYHTENMRILILRRSLLALYIAQAPPRSYYFKDNIAQ